MEDKPAVNSIFVLRALAILVDAALHPNTVDPAARKKLIDLEQELLNFGKE